MRNRNEDINNKDKANNTNNKTNIAARKKREAEQRKRYYEKNKEVLLAKKKIWYQENKETINEKDRIRCQKRREEKIAQNKILYLANREKATELINASHQARMDSFSDQERSNCQGSSELNRIVIINNKRKARVLDNDVNTEQSTKVKRIRHNRNSEINTILNFIPIHDAAVNSVLPQYEHQTQEMILPTKALPIVNSQRPITHPQAQLNGLNPWTAFQLQAWRETFSNQNLMVNSQQPLSLHKPKVPVNTNNTNVYSNPLAVKNLLFSNTPDPILNVTTSLDLTQVNNHRGSFNIHDIADATSDSAYKLMTSNLFKS